MLKKTITLLTLIATSITASTFSYQLEYDEANRVTYTNIDAQNSALYSYYPNGSLKSVQTNGDVPEDNKIKASFVVSPDSAKLGTLFQFDASSSRGENLKYRWDFDGDGVWDSEYKSSPLATFKFSEVGSYQSKLMVSNGEINVSHTKTVTVTKGDTPDVPFSEESNRVQMGIGFSYALLGKEYSTNVIVGSNPFKKYKLECKNGNDSWFESDYVNGGTVINVLINVKNGKNYIQCWTKDKELNKSKIVTQVVHGINSLGSSINFIPSVGYLYINTNRIIVKPFTNNKHIKSASPLSSFCSNVNRYAYMNKNYGLVIDDIQQANIDSGGSFNFIQNHTTSHGGCIADSQEVRPFPSVLAKEIVVYKDEEFSIPVVAGYAFHANKVKISCNLNGKNYLSTNIEQNSIFHLKNTFDKEGRYILKCTTKGYNRTQGKETVSNEIVRNVRVLSRPTIDSDKDGIPDYKDNCYQHKNNNQLDFDHDDIGDVCDIDDDNDGLLDDVELANGLNPLDATDADKDNDGDGYSNREEIEQGSDINDRYSKPEYKIKARFNAYPKEGYKSTTFQFDALLSVGDNLLYRWDFDGDGSFDTAFENSSLRSFDYSTIGDYTVKLQVKDSDGDMDETTIQIKVNEDKLQKEFKEIKLVRSDEGYDNGFGIAVDIDGDFAVIGANRDSTQGNSAGACYIFKKQSDGNWSEVQKLTAGEATQFYGTSVTISGNYMAVGSDMNDAVYIYQKLNSGKWIRVHKLQSNTTGQHFGRSVALDGNSLIVGAYADNSKGSVYIYQRQNGSWVYKQKLTSTSSTAKSFGNFVSLSSKYLVVGDWKDTQKGTMAGAFSIYSKNSNGTYTYQHRAVASDGTSYANLGLSLSISDDYMVIGDKDSSYLFKRSGNRFSEIQKYSGKVVKLYKEYMLIGDTAHKRVEIYKLKNGTWSKIKMLPISNHWSSMGESIALTESDIIVSGSIFSSFDPTKADLDSDGDGYVMANDNCPNIYNPSQLDLDKDGIGNVCDMDDDGDKISDELERRYGLNPLDASDANQDDDGDGVSNIDEVRHGTDIKCIERITPAYNPNTGEEKEFRTLCDVPNRWIVGNAPDYDGDGKNDIIDLDDDNDGVSDAEEIKAGTNPKDKNDYPSKGMSKEEKALFTIMMNRSKQLNKENPVSEFIPQINIPTILMIEAMEEK